MGDKGEPAEETEREPAAYQEEAGEPREEGALPVRRGGDAVLGDPRRSERATAAQSRPQAPPFPAAPECVLPCPARLRGPKLDSPFQSFFFPITILTILKCEASCVFSISTVSYNHHRSLTPERFRHPQKKPGTPCSCSQFPRAAPGCRHPAPRLRGSTCSGRLRGRRCPPRGLLCPCIWLLPLGIRFSRFIPIQRFIPF